jgi:hypothetical protein
MQRLKQHNYNGKGIITIKDPTNNSVFEAGMVARANKLARETHTLALGQQNRM